MAALITNDGAEQIGKVALGKSGFPGLFLLLYNNNYTPVVTSIYSDFTECTVSGYSTVTLTGANWTDSASGGIATFHYPTITFVFNAYAGPAQTIYGYAIFDAAGKVWIAEKIPSNYPIPLGGGGATLDLTVPVKFC